MTAPEKSRRRLDPSVRGVLVLAVVVVLGLLLLAKAAPSSSTSVATRNNPGPTLPPTTKPPTPTTRSATTTPTTLGIVHPVAQVKVLVLNGTGGKIPLAAGMNTPKIKAKGYVTLAPGNGATQPKSAVFYAPGYQADAVAVGAVLNLQPSLAVPVPTPPPAPNAAQANVIVLLGQDFPA